MTQEKDSAIKRVLTTEVKYIIGVATFILGVVAPYYNIKQDIALIKENHFAHMETMTRDILKLQEDQKECSKKYIEVLNLIYSIKK
jgi:hypothetical protein